MKKTNLLWVLLWAQSAMYVFDSAASKIIGLSFLTLTGIYLAAVAFDVGLPLFAYKLVKKYASRKVQN